MEKKNYYLAIVAIVFLILAGSYYMLSMNNNTEVASVSDEGYTSINTENLEKSIPQTQTTVLTEAEKEDMLYMREEEKLARDVYIKLYEKWNIPIFDNISNSEQTHTDSMKFLIDRYGLKDTYVNEIGKYTNEDLQLLYETLVEKGNLSLEDALEVGAAIEEIDIIDLKEAIANSDKADIKTVYENLMKGSRNHLRSFVSNMKSRGYSYVPQYLSQEEFDQIINSSIERGNN
ncbi:MAG TPA: DUF2202 domain-containing protein [Methanofastidiosum sp.]|jgi:hypothetical protein|nr:DUF2202 domain-containing protein [Methanofastidiosum sp.]HQK63396.1 DUF2202 domain-containing protein [Methanofastidiosum sp.]HQM95280.1 DUF2202 domain-containing protein [Methanofastidiosum sp.]